MRDRLALAGYLVLVLFGALVFWRLETTIERVDELRHNRALVTTQADLIICKARNSDRDILADLVRGIIVAGRSSTPRQNPVVRHELQLALHRLRPIDCTALPSNDGMPGR